MFEIDSRKLRSGLDRLLTAPKDLHRWDAHIGDLSPRQASEEHRQLFRAYIAELRPAVTKAIGTWQAEVDWNANACGDLEHAVGEQWMTYPAGPAVQPFFVALIRRYWAACDALNRKVPISSAVTPETFLLGWVIAEDGEESDPAKVLCCMPYWPIGLDEKSNWC